MEQVEKVEEVVLEDPDKRKNPEEMEVPLDIRFVQMVGFQLMYQEELVKVLQEQDKEYQE